MQRAPSLYIHRCDFPKNYIKPFIIFIPKDFSMIDYAKKIFISTPQKENCPQVGSNGLLRINISAPLCVRVLAYNVKNSGALRPQGVVYKSFRRLSWSI